MAEIGGNTGYTGDTRWLQRLANFRRALKQVRAALQLGQQRGLTELEQQGLIQAFEYTHELAWNVMKDYLAQFATSRLIGSRDSTRAAFAAELIESGEDWMDMIVSRNLTSHTYNLETAAALAKKIAECYAPLFSLFEQKMSELERGIRP